VDEDEVFNYISKEKVDNYEKVYVGGKTWELKVNGKIVLR